MKLTHILFLLLLLPMLVSADYADREDVREFVRELAAEAEFNENELLSVFRHAEYKQTIIDAISRPAEKRLTWAEYQDIFLTDRRIDRGLAFMQENAAVLDTAESVFGVPPEIVAAIIGVETMYGRITGSYRVLDALTTLSFDYPPRARFFRGELKQFILLAREEKQMITDLTGSYAGAMGLGQFIPSSYRAYAVDFDEDGVRDIWTNRADAIGSVANYLNEHGWRRGEAITMPVEGQAVPGEIYNESLKPSRSVGELVAMGLPADIDLDLAMEVSPMRFQGKRGDEFWVGLHNFYVITRYNHSKLYAMAVYQLSEQLRRGTGTLANR